MAKKTKLRNYVIIDGKEYEGKSTIKKYSHAVVWSKNGKSGITALSADKYNAEKRAAAEHKDCLKLLKQGYDSQAGYSFYVHNLLTEPIL